MSAAHWRKAMNAGSAARDWAGGRATAGQRSNPPTGTGAGPRSRRATQAASRGREDAELAPADAASIWRGIGARHVIMVLALLVFPALASPFVTFQIAAQSFVLGTIALSLTFLAGYGGMVSLAQMSVAGVAGYTVAILGVNGSPEISVNMPWWGYLPIALVLAAVASTLVGWLSVRTEGIYTIMITLAIGVAFYYLTLQNYSVFNGFQGLQKVLPPAFFGIDLRAPVPFYFFTLFWALACYLFVKYLLRAPFGIALQGIRDNPRRMSSLGFHVTAHRVAAYAVAGLIAGIGGILLVWYNGLITPGSIGTSWLINILVIAVLGGMRHPIGPYLGALVFVLLQTFAIDLIDRERFNLVIGSVFLAIVLFSPDGLLGLWTRVRSRFAAAGARPVTSTVRPQSRH
jgi:branched-chain amino acid transport system permease protein